MCFFKKIFSYGDPIIAIILQIFGLKLTKYSGLPIFSLPSLINIDSHSSALDTCLMGLLLEKGAFSKVVDVVANAKIDVEELFSNFHSLATYFCLS